MRNSVITRILATLGLATGLLAIPLAALADHTVPFKGTCYGVYVSEDDANYGHIGVRVHGNSTLLGAFTGIIYNGSHVVLWACNGDELWGDLSGNPFLVIGGTGRFENATGAWTIFDGDFNETGFFHFFSGQISSVGSNN
jgi:hypothetical protein